jgi:putative transposase
MCQALGVTRGGYYRWEVRPKSRRAVENERLLFEIRCAYDRSRRTYGSPRITAELNNRGFACSKPRVARLMRRYYIRAKTKRRYRITTHSKHNLPIARDLVKRQFIVPKPNIVWASDITYIKTDEGWLYLAVVMDLYSRRVVGWAMKDRLYREIVMEAFQQAVWRRKPGQGLIFHSDHGSQYASHEFRALVKQNKARSSMSRIGNCYDNAVMESFFKTLKTELVHDEQYYARKEARKSIFEYIEVFYNGQRRHSLLGYKSPAEFEETSKVS